MGRQFRQLRAAVEIPLLRDLSANEPALHLHGRLAARARALLPARRHACGGRLVPAGRARARVFEAVLLELSSPALAECCHCGLSRRLEQGVWPRARVKRKIVTYVTLLRRKVCEPYLAKLRPRW